MSDFVFSDPHLLFADIFNKELDTTWLINNDQKIFTIIPTEKDYLNIKDDGSIIYKYNIQKFRSDDFITSHDGTHILFSGCSETEGVGGNIDDAWSKILYDRISEKEKCSGFFNLARSGWGWTKIIPNSLIYFEKYGYPDYFFIMLPNNQRRFVHRMKGFAGLTTEGTQKEWIYWQKYPESYLKDDPNISGQNQETVINEKEYFEHFVYFLICWPLFEKFCQSKNIKLIFSTWDVTDKTNINLIKKSYSENFLNSFLSIDRNSKDIDKYAKMYYKTNEIKKDDHVKRDGHSGRIIHSFWADRFYNKYLEEKNND